MLTPESWQNMVLKYKRKGLDAELQEKCGAKLSHGTQDFRFLQAFGCTISTATVPERCNRKLELCLRFGLSPKLCHHEPKFCVLRSARGRFCVSVATQLAAQLSIQQFPVDRWNQLSMFDYERAKLCLW